MIELTLPWPPAVLSPNARSHWAKLANAKKSYRALCWLVSREQKPGPVPPGPLLLDLTFCPPDRRSYDRDNCVARFKAGIDGIADALYIDDKRFTTLAARVSTDVGGFVRVRISKESE